MLVPRVYGHVLRLSAAIVILALLTGGMLMGILGALLALPIAAGLQMIIRELRVDMPGDDSSDVKLRAREERAERVYESLSSGTLPEDAAVIATDLAQEIRQADAALPVPAPTAIPEGPAEHHAGLSKDDPLK